MKILISTGQPVFSVPFLVKGRSPIPDSHVRIFRQFLPHEGLKSRNVGEVIVVCKESIKEVA